MITMDKARLTVRSINDLLGEKFFVPSYQRGYRWTPRQVEDLLNDIWDFHRKETSDKKEFYCLQPIVVTSHNDQWELIDGQQRLTTIFLLLQYLRPDLKMPGKKSYTLQYKTRKDSESFLQNIQLNNENDNIDYYHFCQAYKTIRDWFDAKGEIVKENFLTTLLNDDNQGKNVKVIWYQVDGNSNPVDIFTRINIGKIPLNNAELIRALFLRKGNFEKSGSASYTFKQLQIAGEWDMIENTLQQDEFWFFIVDGNVDYPSRIELIFNLMYPKKQEDEEYFTFHAFNDAIQNGEDIDKLWLSVKRCFQTFRDWFNDHYLYHIIGYLVCTGSSISELMNRSKGLSKINFKHFLESEIRKKCQFRIQELHYEDKQVKPLLLLFNIQTILNSRNCEIRFPFHRFKDKKNGWDIEHIRSVKSDMPQRNKQKAWLQNVLEYFTGNSKLGDLQLLAIAALKPDEEKLAQSIYDLLSEESFSHTQFVNLYEQLLVHFEEDNQPENINSLSNLALLDSSTNRSYQNAVFPVKRKTIISRDKEGVFIPMCTKNVFMKAYSNRIDNVMFWQERDANDYLSAILDCLSIYLPDQIIENAISKSVVVGRR